MSGPHEFGYFWSHVFGFDRSRTHNLSEAERAAVEIEFLAASLRGLLAESAYGFVFKNLTCGFQAGLLKRVHPNSVFVHVTRDLLATAASILHWRKTVHGDYRHWLSLKPSVYPLSEYAGDAVAQVIAQITATEAELAAAFAQAGIRPVTFRYEEFCRDPSLHLDRLCKALAETGAAIERRDCDLPQLESAAPAALPDDLMSRLRTLCAASAATGACS
jgi:hypothetical protein